ncbi:sulfotransferase family cytosolic 2B member 1-like isoform X2 [Rhinatrema bivittatum]|nr:sulfotransferase family cytosolic 2B member 1-like isoform X2 [Rhinatrema bivittatum]
MMEILSLVHKHGDPSWCHAVPIWNRVPWCETCIGLEVLRHYMPPRLITSHLSIQLFPKSFFGSKAKIIYVLRDPKDVVTSFYYYSKIHGMFKDPESFPQFLDNFLQGNVPYGSWFDHVCGWMKMKGQSNFFFITYEELLQDLRGSVVRICDFLGQELDEAAIDSVVENATFKTMKDNKMANFSQVSEDIIHHSKGRFMRKGISGDWKNNFTMAQSERFNRVYQEKMKDLGTKFPWDTDC